MTRLVLFELFVTNLLLFEHHEKLLVSWQFSGPYGVTKYSSGWRKDVVHQCLEFAAHSEHRFPAPSSELCQIWLRHWRGTLYLRAGVQRRCQRSPKGSGTNITVEAT